MPKRKPTEFVESTDGLPTDAQEFRGCILAPGTLFGRLGIDHGFGRRDGYLSFVSLLTLARLA